ncbi:MAG: hypothetical protein ACYST6_10520, partial [Planctomycetota bacterium]
MGEKGALSDTAPIHLLPLKRYAILWQSTTYAYAEGHLSKQVRYETGREVRGQEKSPGFSGAFFLLHGPDSYKGPPA